MRREFNPIYIGQQNRMPCRPLLYPRAFRTRDDLETEEIRRVALIENKEYLSEQAVALDSFEANHLVDQGWKKGAIRLGHFCTEGRSGARKFTVERSTTSLRWL